MHFGNFYCIVNVITEVRLYFEINFDLQVVEWESNNVYSWIKYIMNNSTLIMNPTTINASFQCAKLVSNDSCHNLVYSNPFYIFIKLKKAPPFVGDVFGPLYVYSGQLKLFEIPDDLFISTQHLDLDYSVSIISWSINSKLYVNITK